MFVFANQIQPSGQSKEQSMRSLRDLLLEQTVLNFGDIFSKEKQSVPFKVENGKIMAVVKY